MSGLPAEPLELELNRNPTLVDTTFSTLYVGGQLECSVLEDTLREVPGVAVVRWKIYGKTAIPAGRRELILADSPHFGSDTMTICNVEGFDLIRIHSGETALDTDGCLIVGDQVDLEKRTIHGGKAHGVLARLKEKVVHAIRVEKRRVFITINNPPGYAGPDQQGAVA